MPKANKTACVITTINAVEHGSIYAWAQIFDRVYVVTDKKTPQIPDATPHNVVFVTGDMCGVWNHYSRKMLGYLEAYRDGYGFIFETDDDNYPLPDVKYEHQPAALEATGAWFNVFKHAGLNNICPRGFPVAHSTNCSVRLAAYTPTGTKVPVVTQWWCENDPDVWAFYRMDPNYESYVKNHRMPATWPVRLAPWDYTYCSTNTQMTLLTLRPDLMKLYYLPVTCTHRASDILRGWLLLSNLYEMEEFVHFAGPGVIQYRNPHDLMKDMAQEIRMLDRFTWPCISVQKLIDAGHCSDDEWRYYDWWCKQLEEAS